MEEREKESEFRWKKGDQFIDEIHRMDDLMAELQKITSLNSTRTAFGFLRTRSS